MLTDLEIHQCAKVLIDKRGGDGATDYCDNRIAHLAGERDTEGVDVWKRVRAAVRNLVDDAPGPDAVVH